MKALLDKSGDWGTPEDFHEKFMLPIDVWIGQRDSFFDFVSSWNTYGHNGDGEHWKRGRIYKQRLYKKAREIAQALYGAYYEGKSIDNDLRFEPHVGVYYIPDPACSWGYIQLYFVFKWDNNGTSLIVEHKEFQCDKNPLPGVIIGWLTDDKQRLSK